MVKPLTSLFNGYPIGGLLFMENTEGYGFRVLDGAPEEAAKGKKSSDLVLVLDGQQRLTSCYRAFFGSHESSRHPGRFYFNYEKYVSTTDEDRKSVEGSNVENFVEFKTSKEVSKSLADTAAEISVGLFPLDIIFQSPRGTDYSKWLSDFAFLKAKGVKAVFDRYSSVQSEFIRTFVERITGYQVHLEEIKKGTNPDVICTVFETINTTGKRLTVFDLLVARCYPKDVRLRDFLDAAIEHPIIRRFDPTGEDICVTSIPRIVSLLDKKQCRRADMLQLAPRTIQEHWDRAVESLKKALDTMAQKFGCLGPRFMPLVDMVAPLAMIVGSSKFVDNDTNHKKLARWYWRCVFSSYFVSSTETKIARTVRDWLDDQGWLTDDAREPEAVREFLYTDSILDGVSRIDSAVYLGVMSLLLSRGVTDFGKERTRIGPSNDLVWSDIEDHHIYPKGFLVPYGIKGDAANTIVNRTPILGKTNGVIKNAAPHGYLRDPNIAGPKAVEDEVLKQHAIPAGIARTAFDMTVYKSFVEGRRRLLLERIAQVVEAAPNPSGDA